MDSTIFWSVMTGFFFLCLYFIGKSVNRLIIHWIGFDLFHFFDTLGVNGDYSSNILKKEAKVSKWENILTFIRGIQHSRGKGWQYAMNRNNPIRFDSKTGTYLNSSLFRGFPVSSIGSGGFGIATEGGFLDFRINNNWMRPIRKAKGSFWAISYLNQKTQTRSSFILRRNYFNNDKRDGREYENIAPFPGNISFNGKIPFFQQRFYGEDSFIPIEVNITGFSPLIPHNLKDSSLPVACFKVKFQNIDDEEYETSFLFSFENILGRGGTGQTGFRNLALRLLAGKVHYDCVEGNYQEPLQLNVPNGKILKGLKFATTQQYPLNSHRSSCIGEYLLAVESQMDVETTLVNNWNSNQNQPSILEAFSKTGKCSPESSINGNNITYLPSGAICNSFKLRPRESKELVFYFAWWMPNHVTEKNVALHAKTNSNHCGVRVGHYYERFFQNSTHLLEYVVYNINRLEKESIELRTFLSNTTIPFWLQTCLLNSIDSVIMNTILPKDGTMYTIEGMDWDWFFGGLLGTQDQRISACPFTSLFFTEADISEIEMFRKLHKNGEVSHGNGNCDLSLGDSSVPYGVPVFIKGMIEEEHWPDLTLGQILQSIRLIKITGDKNLMNQSKNDILQMIQYLKANLEKEGKGGIPVGGSTFDVFSFPGKFIYTGTLFVSALNAVLEHIELTSAQREEITRMRNLALKDLNSLWDLENLFFHSTDRKNTVFLCSLAGEWFSRFAGFSNVFPIAQVRSHLKLVHNLFVESNDGFSPKGPYPFAECDVQGNPIHHKVMGLFSVATYCWQVISYHSLLCIHVGLVREGISSLKLIYNRIYQMGFPFSANLNGNADNNYMTHPVLWGFLTAISGATLDVEKQVFRISPKKLLTETEIDAEEVYPICFPSFWGYLHIQFQSSKSFTGLFRIIKIFGTVPIKLKTLEFIDEKDNIAKKVLDPIWTLKEGQQFKFSF